jgi:hypothetical protein
MKCTTIVVIMLAVCRCATAAYDLVGVGWHDLNSPIYRLDSSTGSAQFVGSSGAGSLNALACDSSGVIYAAGASDRLYTINPQTGAASLAATISLGSQAVQIRALAFAPDGTLYALENGMGTSQTTTNDEIWTINESTGVGAFVGLTNLFGIQAMEFGPNGTLYGWDCGNTGSNGFGLVTIDPVTGAATDVNPAIGGTADVQSITFRPDGSMVGGGFSLFSINPMTGAQTFTGSTGNDLRGFVYIPEPTIGAATLLPVSTWVLARRATMRPKR